MPHRTDSWTEDEDLLLADKVLKHVREGSTQLRAFEEVSNNLNRTSASVNARWNNVLRKKYDSALDIAKRHRKKLMEKNPSPIIVEEEKNISLEESSSIPQEGPKALENLDELIRLANSLKDELGREIENTTSNQKLIEENEELKAELNSIKHDYELMKEDYGTLTEIMERAREMSVFKSGSNRITEMRRRESELQRKAT